MDLLLIVCVIGIFAYIKKIKGKDNKPKLKDKNIDTVVTEYDYDVMFFDLDTLKKDADGITVHVSDKLTCLSRQGLEPVTDTQLTSDGLLITVTYKRC